MLKKGFSLIAGLLVCVLVLAGCQNSTPTNSKNDIVPIETAEQLVNELTKTDLPIGNVIIYNEQTDPNQLLGQQNGYIGKVSFADFRIYQTDVNMPNGGSVEVFKSSADAEKRKRYIDQIGEATSMMAEKSFIHNTFLVRIDRRVRDDEYEQYKTYVEQSFINGVTNDVAVEYVSDEEKANITNEQTVQWQPLKNTLLKKNFVTQLKAQLLNADMDLNYQQNDTDKWVYAINNNKKVYETEISFTESNKNYKVVLYADKEGIVYYVELVPLNLKKDDKLDADFGNIVFTLSSVILDDIDLASEVSDYLSKEMIFKAGEEEIINEIKFIFKNDKLIITK